MNRFLLGLTIVLFHVQTVKSQHRITPETALQAYLDNGDRMFRWEIKERFEIGDVRAYTLLLTSQQWHEYVWTHQLTVLVPTEVKYDGALLFISGGSNKKGAPNWTRPEDKLIHTLSEMATRNQAITVLLRQTPNQPLYGDLTEDALISYTLHMFKEDGDYSWPLLFPMVKSAVKAMDAVQEFSSTELHHAISRFVVTGASKRGWTTWLTGATDSRVAAIAPMVIDVLNMPVNLDYQLKMWNDYSVQIEDYVKLGIPQTARSEKGAAITTMVDPYSYRKQLTMPKLLFMGTNDEYWTVDAIKHYIDSIPGKNYVHYVPNVGHSLGDGKQAMTALGAFFGSILSGRDFPECAPELVQGKKGIALNVTTTPDILVDAILWSTHSVDTDFRDEKWESERIPLKKNPSVVTARQDYPVNGYRAFYLDLKYRDPNGGEYTESTRMYVADNDEVFVK